MNDNSKCPKCGGEGKTSPLAGMLRCEKCAHYFIGPVLEPAVAPVPLSNAAAKAITNSARSATASSEQIEKLAKSFANGAALLALTSGALFIFFLIWKSYLAAVICGSALGVSLWFFLFAQLLYLRALLIKK